MGETRHRTQVRYNRLQQALYNQPLKKKNKKIKNKCKCCWSKKRLNKMFRGF